MLTTTLKITWRRLLKDRQFTLLNLVGLAIGLACTFLIYLWVNDELMVDKFHRNGHRIYQVMERQQINDAVVVKYRTAGLVADELAQKMPEVEYATPVTHYSWFSKFIVSASPEHKVNAVGQFAGKDFFRIFSYELAAGDASQVLMGKNAIVLSEDLAKRLFHTTDNIIGKFVEWEYAGLKRPVSVTGVFKGTPPASSEQFDFVLSFEDFKDISPSVMNWGNDGTNAYVMLKQGTNVDQLNKKLAALLGTKLDKTNRALFLKPFSQKYLYGNYENGVQTGGRIEYVKLFSIIAIFILIIACINFMNLSTAKATRRLKEIGIKKTAGASRAELVFQFIGESMMMAFASMIVSVIIVWLLLPQFNAITGKQLSVHLDGKLIGAIIGITLFTGIISGSYPAIYLSGFKPAIVLKGKLKTSAAELFVRKGLVVFQFTLAVVFIIAVLVVYRQIGLIQTKNLGYDKENVVYFEKGQLSGNLDGFLTEVRKIPGVLKASSIDHRFSGSLNTTGGVEWQGKDPNQSMEFEIFRVNYDMIELLGMQMKEGRAFSRNFGSDTSRILFNEAAVKLMGMQQPVGKIVKVWGKEMEIAGVVKDFHFESLHENVKPLFITLEPLNTLYVAAKIDAGREQEVLSQLQRVYETYNPESPFDYQFLSQDYQALYVAEERVGVLSRYFAGIAIIVSCLGLFGLAAFTAQKRQKEISIRKVVGASTGNVVVLLSKDFLKLIVIAVLIAFPLAWWMTNQWLNGFAYRVRVGADVFLIAGACTVIIALITISFQSIRAALADPIGALRSE